MICPVLFLFFLCPSIQAGSEWSYSDFKAWGKVNKVCVEGKRQSPIDINLYELVQKSDKCPILTFSNYDVTPKSLMLTNNGHSVSLTGSWPENKRPRITSSNDLLQNDYIFDNFHLHWSQNDNNGSEHKLLGNGYPAEGHLVHYNSKYSSVKEAGNYPDGYAVLGFRFALNTNSDNIIFNKLPNVVQPNTSVKLQPTALEKLHATCQRSFIYYYGSLTTPPCTQNVQWILCTKPLYVTEDDLDKLRSVQLNHGDKSNTRPTQPLNNRTVYAFSCSKK